ncbi:MAG: diacylglycerol/lipid kinase family protein [Solirubrobacteraceae bacterium]
MKRRAAAIAALVVGAAFVIGEVVVLIGGWGDARPAILCLALAAGAAWYGIYLRGSGRVIGLVLAALGVAGAVVLVVSGESAVAVGAIALAAVVTMAAAHVAFTTRVPLPSAPAPRHPVLFWNPFSGGGKAKRLNLADEARKRGIESIELHKDDDLETLVRDAVARGADALAMAGGDGSQAIVAKVAASLNIPYACVPAGTRNHFAVDLGVDRYDVVGGLDALVEGRERVVDLGDVNGRIFVNNVSLGLYGEAVQRSEYRNSKLRTILATVPDVLGPEAARSDLRWEGPKGHERTSRTAVLVSNDRYRFDRLVAVGTRPRMDEGVLGVTVLQEGDHALFSRWREFAAPTFDVDASQPVPAGIDGEAVELKPPLQFKSRPRALRVRIARGQPGASPAAGTPAGWGDGIRSLLRLAGGGDNNESAMPTAARSGDAGEETTAGPSPVK